MALINNIMDTILSIVLIILLILVGLTYFDVIDNPFQKNNIYDDVKPPEYEPEKQITCTVYDISTEYKKAFGTTNIQTLEDGCIAVGGIWTETNKELSCYWNPSVHTLDCTQTGVQVMKDFCEDNLLAKYTCDNTIAYAGCSCKITLPSNWLPPSDDDQPPEEEYQTGDIGTIFVSKNVWNGAMGGIAGANDKCKISAQFSGLTGEYIALISKDGYDIRDWLVVTEYRRLDGKLVAKSINDLFDGSITNPINIDENGNTINFVNGVWTGTTASGQSTGMNCNDWTWVSADGTKGDATSTTSSYLTTKIESCALSNHIYCVRVN